MTRARPWLSIGWRSRGCVAANVNLGLCYEKGRGVPLDRAEAERLYQFAARSVSAHALTSASHPWLF
jgi:TPR repeat protein